MMELLKNKRVLISLITTLLILVGVGLGVFLVRQRQQTSSEASVVPIEFLPGECVFLRNGTLSAKCANVQFRLNSPARLANGCFEIPASPNNGAFRPNNFVNQVSAAENNPRLLAQFHPGESASLNANPNPCTLTGGQSLCRSTISWSTSGVNNVCLVVDNSGPFACGLNGTAEAPWINTGGNFFELYKDFVSLQNRGTRLATLTVSAQGLAAHPSPSAILSPSPSPSTTVQSPSPSPSPSPSLTPSLSPSPAAPVVSCSQIFYKFSETAAGLVNAPTNVLDTTPKTIDYTFSDPSPGLKSIYVEFSDGTGGIQRSKADITLLAPAQQNSGSVSPSVVVSPSPSPSIEASVEPSPSPSLLPSPSPSPSVVAGGPESPSPLPSLSPSPAASIITEPSPSPSSQITPSPSPSVSETASSTPLASVANSPQVSTTPISSTNTGSGVQYRLAETEAGLSSASFRDFTQNPLLTNFNLSNENAGSKQIWVEFKDNATGQTNKERLTIRLISKPKVAQADCTLNINRQDLRVTLKGSGFGNGPGSLTHEQKELEIAGWNDNQVVGILPNPGLSANNGKTYQFTFKRNDDIEFSEPILCRVDTAMVALGARIFCRRTGEFDVPNTKIILTDENNNRVDETVTINKDGTISGLKTKLQEGRPYAVTIQAPNSLSRNAYFVAGSGTSFVTNQDGSPLILPVGDISPNILSDGKINTLDRAEIVRQWSVLNRGNNSRTADFNRDTKVNSIDWACMRYDFNEENETLPNLMPAVSSPLPIPSTVSSVSTQPTSTPVPSPLPSGQRAAYFLPTPVGTGSYPVNTEFSVNINLWSQSEASNLFSAQMSFDPSRLEVVRIDKGSVLTSWTDDSFSNSAGQISLIAGLPNPGLRTTEGNDPLMAKIIFKGKQAGNATITMTNESAIYSNSDNANIISALISASVAITQ